jgi:acetyltransferase-like isoleucine patch superfamily enzyme
MNDYKIIKKMDIAKLIELDLLEIGDGTIIDEDVYLCHYIKGGIHGKTIIGRNCIIRSGTVIYCDTHIGDGCNFGQHVVVREGCRIGNNTSIGTGVKVECYTEIGNNVSIETQSHITGWMKIDDYVFIGGFVGTTNDFYMNYKRPRHGQDLQGAWIKKGARIGSGAILLPRITIGEYAIVNAGEVVRKNVPDNMLMFTRKDVVRYKPTMNNLIEEK